MGGLLHGGGEGKGYVKLFGGGLAPCPPLPTPMIVQCDACAERAKILLVMIRMLLISSEPKAPGELIGWEGSVVRPSVRRPSTISNDFSSETTKPIATKFLNSLQGF